MKDLVDTGLSLRLGVFKTAEMRKYVPSISPILVQMTLY